MSALAAVQLFVALLIGSVIGQFISDRLLKRRAPKSEPSQPTKAAQPAPISNDLPAVWEIVISDMRGRDALGRHRYGTPLQPHNGRDALRDAYEEALDLCVYMRQAIYERDGR